MKTLVKDKRRIRNFRHAKARGQKSTQKVQEAVERQREKGRD
jgi:hypothetical protein